MYSSGAYLHGERPTCAVFAQEDWITLGGQSLLWLPTDYRTRCSAFYNNMLVLGLAAGEVVFLEFVSSQVDITNLAFLQLIHAVIITSTKYF